MPRPTGWPNKIAPAHTLALFHLRHKLGDGIPGGCRQVDVQTYRDNTKIINGINLCEFFHPDSERPKTHFCSDIARGMNVGQRIDHFIVDQGLLDGTCDVSVQAFSTLQERERSGGLQTTAHFGASYSGESSDAVEVHNVTTGSRVNFRRQSAQWRWRGAG